MSKEIERKWIVNNPPDLKDCSVSHIEQGYTVVDDNGDEVRIRSVNGSKFVRTTKKGNGLVRTESQKLISEKEFRKEWLATEGRRVYKDRYKLPWGDFVIEIDFYRGHRQGLVIAEVEFDDESKAMDFNPPIWFGNEVTYDPAYKNQNLALEE